MSAQQGLGQLPSPTGQGCGRGRYAVGNAGGRYFAVTRRCRHLRADLAGGSIDEDGCLVWPLALLGLRRRDRPDGPGTAGDLRQPGLDFGYELARPVTSRV
jgi:hypothetical protein